MTKLHKDDLRKDVQTKLSDLPEFITRKELAEFLRVSVSTLKRWGEEGVGPKPVYLRPRAPRYEKAAVEEYLTAVKQGPGQERAPVTAPVAASAPAPAPVAAPAPVPGPAPTPAPTPTAAPAAASARPADRVLTPQEREARDAVERAAADARTAPVRPGGRMLSPEEREARAAARPRGFTPPAFASSPAPKVPANESADAQTEVQTEGKKGLKNFLKNGFRSE